MLQLLETRIVRTTHSPVLSGSIIHEEGMALVYGKEDGETKVTTSSGVAGEIFAGVSTSRNSPPAVLPYVDESLVPSNGQFELTRTPLPGQLLVKVGGVQRTVVAAAPADATEVQLSGGTLIFANGQGGQTLFAQYIYEPTITEARMQVGDQPIGGLSSTMLSVIGVLKDAQIGTNMFDASVDWTNAMYVKTAPNGTFTVGDAADHIPNVIVKNAPSAANPFLVLTMTVA